MPRTRSHNSIFFWKREDHTAMPVAVSHLEPFFCFFCGDKFFAGEWRGTAESGFAEIKGADLFAIAKEPVRFKLVGSQSKVTRIRELLESLGWTCENAVVREGPFEVLYDWEPHRLRISREEAAPPARPTPTPTVAAARVMEKIRVLIVDDSSTIRLLLNKFLSNDPQILVVGMAERPSQVEDLILQQKPDVITLDINMPEMDGVTLLKQIFPKYHIPTIMISAISKEEGPQILEALEHGAVDYIQKPQSKDLVSVGASICESIKIAAQAQVKKKRAVAPQSRIVSSGYDPRTIVLIGSSTGGTEALRQIFVELPAQIPPILVVQHIPAVFSKALADRLDSLCQFHVKEAQDGDLVEANKVLIAPGGMQMGIKKRGDQLRVELTQDAPVNRHKPSVDYLFDSMAQKNLKHLVGIILTGMGADGAKGLKTLRDQGARTIAQDKDSCIVFGMPREAIERGGAEFVLPLDGIPQKLVELSQASATRRPAA
jgi:two-component system chemotaxis response regulator CheB